LVFFFYTGIIVRDLPAVLGKVSPFRRAKHAEYGICNF
jgi:hypothetical protein